MKFLLHQLVYSLKGHDRCDSKFSKYMYSFGNHSAFQAEGYLQFPELSVVRLIEYSSSRNSGPSSLLSALVDIHCIRYLKICENLNYFNLILQLENAEFF